MAQDYQNPYIDQSAYGISPAAIDARRKYALSIMQQAGDGSPTKANAIGALARAMQGAMGGYFLGQANRDEQQGVNAEGQMWANAAQKLNSDGQPPTAPQSPSQAAQPMGAGAATAGKIYNENEPSPLDPPSGNARDLLIRTIYGEDPGKSALGVANVIRNRTVNGGFGGDTVPGVVMAKNQFEPWNNAPAKARMLALAPNSPDYARLGGVVDQAYAGNDPTNGATNFYSPTAQAALGRNTPQWAQGQGQDIGTHRFFGGAQPGPGQQPYQVASLGQAGATAGGPAQPPAMPPQSPQGAPPQTPPQAVPPQQMAQAGMPPPQGGQPQSGGQPTPAPQQQQMIQQLIATTRDPAANVYQKQAASKMLQSLVQKQMGAEMKYVPQPDGSVAWFNPFNPSQNGRITDPGMIQRLGAVKQSEGYGTAAGTNQANIDYGPQTAALKGAEAKATSFGTESGKQQAVSGGLGNMNTDLMAAVPSKVGSALTALDNESPTNILTGKTGVRMAAIGGTAAANLQDQLNQIESALTSAFINKVKETSPEGRGASTEQIDQFKRSIGLNIGDKEALRNSLLRLQGVFPAPRSNAPVNMTPGAFGFRANAGEGTQSGGFRIMKVTPPNGG